MLSQVNSFIISAIDKADIQAVQTFINYAIAENSKFNSEDIRGNDNQPLLYNIIKADCPEILKLLLNKGMMINMSAEENNKIIQCITTHQSTNILPSLFQLGLKIDEARISEILLLIVQKNNVEALNALWDHQLKSQENFDINKFKYENDESLLHISTKLGHKPITNKLLEYGINIEAKDKNELTAFHLAFYSFNTDLMELFIKSSIDNAIINIKDSEGNTPLHVAIAKYVNGSSFIDILMRNGANIHFTNNDGKTPLMLALDTNNQTILNLLFQYNSLEGSQISSEKLEGNLEIYNAIRNNDLKKLQKLIEDRPSLIAIKDATQYTLLHHAVEKQAKESDEIKQTKDIIEFLMVKGADPFAKDINGHTPLYLANENKYLAFFDIVATYNVRSLIHYAIEQNLVNMVVALVKFPQLLTQRNDSWQTPIEKAIELARIDILGLLLPHDQNFNEKLEKNYNLLHIAAEQGWANVVEELLKECSKSGKSLLSSQNSTQQTPLHLAIQKNHSEIVKLFLSNKADITILQDNEGNTCLKLALSKGPTTMKLFIENEENYKQDKEGKSLLHWIVYYGYGEYVKDLISHYVTIDISTLKGDTPLHIACAEGHNDIVELLLDNEAAIDNKGTGSFTPLHYATLNNRLETVKILIANNADLRSIEDKGYTPLHLAAKLGNKELIELLLKTDHKPARMLDSEGNTPLTLAALEGNIDACEALIKHSKIKEQWKEENGDLLSIKYIAAIEGWNKLIEKYSERKADLSEASLQGSNTLYLAIKFGNKETVKLLLSKGADVNSTSINNNSALHFAIKTNHLDIAEILLQQGAKVNFLGNNNHTALHYAVKLGSVAAVKLLLQSQYKANIYIKNTDNYTPLDKAVNNSNFDIVKIIFDNAQEFNEQRSKGYKLLHIAVQQGWSNVINKLLDLNSNEINIKTKDDNTPLKLALIEGNASTVKKLIEKGANIKDPTIKDIPLLHHIIKMNDVSLVNLLIAKGVNINEKDSKGKTPLDVAIGLGNSEITKILLDQGANLAEVDNEGNLPIHYASMIGNTLIIEASIKAGISVEVKNHAGITPLHLAIVNNMLTTVNFLLTKGANIATTNLNGESALHLAIEFGNKQMIEVISTKGPDFNLKTNMGLTPLNYAAQRGDQAILKLLSTKGASVSNKNSANNFTALHFAARDGNLELVKTLLDSGCVTVNDKALANVTPLFLAAENGHVEVVKTLINQYGACTNYRDVNSINNLTKLTPLYIASWNGYTEVVNYLLTTEMKNYVTHKVSDNSTALNIASKNGHTKIVEALINNGANINNKDALGHTALYEAITKSHADTVRFLVEKGANVNDKDSTGNSILHHAITIKSPTDIINLLLDKGANVNEKDSKGLTPLYLAAANNNHELVKILKGKGAIIEEGKELNDTLFHLAAKEHKYDIIKLLFEEGFGSNDLLKNNSFISLLAPEQKSELEDVYLALHPLDQTMEVQIIGVN